MKHHKPAILVAAVALTGCVNWNSFNASNPAQAGTPAAQAKPSPTPVAKTQATKKQPPKASASPTPKTTSSSASSTSSAAAPTPKPTPRIISEESTTTIKVLESRPVVGTDSQMGN